ncbi:MAG TPA: LamG domain-containing protein [Xanthomonadales bacterium]|nr:LamG domain-containing protein [Xanthomonadales bacterium]
MQMNDVPRWLAAALLALAALAAPPLSAQRLESGLIAHYPLDGNLDEATDVVGTPAVRGTLEYDVGAIGRAAKLSGDDEIDFNGIPASTFSGDFTVSWFMNVPRAGNYHFFGKQGSCGASNHFTTHLGKAANPDDLSFVLSSTTASGTATNTIRYGTWVHVAVVRDGARAVVYIDGKPGTARALPTLSLGTVTAPFGLGNSPCVGLISTSGLSRPVGRFDEVRVYNVALAADVIADLALRPVFSASSRTPSVGGRTIVSASHLVVDRNYKLRLVGAVTRELFSGPATSTKMSWAVTIPEMPVGNYDLQLVTTQLRFTSVERELAFKVTPRPTITPSPGLQAGKTATFTIGNLAPGYLRLVYAGRTIAGPALVGRSDHTFKVTLPSDLPASLPATVAMRAELLDGRIVARVGTANVAVAAPFTGKFATTTNLLSSRTLAKPSEPVTLTGRVALADGATTADLGYSAYWVGDNGDVTPLSTDALQFEADGSVQLETRPPSLGAMSAVVPKTAGRIRLVSKRKNEFGRMEWVVEEGPRLETDYDVDADTDITVLVRRRVGGGVTEPLEGAFVVVDSAAPLGYAFDPPDGGDGDSGAPVGGGVFGLHRQPTFGLVEAGRATASAKGLVSGGAAVNQVNNGTADLPPPPPPVCGENLYRRFTDSDGRASFPILGGPEESPQSWQNLSSLLAGAVECTGFECSDVLIGQQYSFFITVYTLHRGAGERNPLTNAERPTRFRVDYDRSIEQFRIRNLATGAESVQNVSANLVVEVTQIASGNFVTISDPLMYHEIGGQPINLVGKTDGGFGRWIDFTGTRVSGFVNPAPDRVIQFAHKPDANGSIVSATLFLPNRITGQPSVVGEFQQVSFVDGCNLQEDPSSNGSETWRLKIEQPLSGSWRFPQDVFFNAGATPSVCGYIQVTNATGGLGKRNVCFHWQRAPGFMYDDGGDIAVNDADMHNVLIERQGSALDAKSTSVPKRNADFFGEPIEQPGRIDNSSNASSGVYTTVGATGETGGVRKYNGNNPKQFSEDAAGTNDTPSFPHGTASIQIGDPEYQTILDQTIPLFQWYWGVPEILSAEVYARLRLFAQYLFSGTLTKAGGDETLDLMTNAVFGAAIMIGVDIDVLFGFIVDAGASLTGLVVSELPVVIENDVVQQAGPCVTFSLRFDGYVDPCAFCPTPVIEFGDEIVDASAPENCTFYSAARGDSELAKLARGGVSPQFGFAEARALRRHATLAYDTIGNGQMAMLDDDGDLMASGVGEALAAGAELSTAPGIRQPQMAYFDADRAIAVWAESAMTEAGYVQAASALAQYPSLARNQRLVWAEWDGDSWGPKQVLTPPGKGEGQIGLTACRDGDAGCPDGGEVIAVWQRDDNADATNPQYRLFYAQFRPATGFGIVRSLDPTPTPGVQDITPAVAYLNGLPVVVWTRQFGGSLNDFQQRNLAFRVLPSGTLGVVAAAPGATAPSIVAGDFSSIRVAYLRADASTSTNPDAANKGAVGTQNALHVTRAACNATTCTFPVAAIPPARDQHGRRIYGERPRVVRGADDAVVLMRVFRFEGSNGQPVQSGDPVGTVLSSGDLLSIAPDYVTGVSRVIPVTADGAMHMGHFAAYDASSRSIVTGSSTFVPNGFVPMRAALKATGHKGQVAYSKAIAAVGAVELRSMVAAPDFAVEAVDQVGTLAPGAAMTTSVTVGNRGTGYVSARDGAVAVQLRWNSPGGPLLATGALGDVVSGGGLEVHIAWTAPATAFADEAHTVHAVLVVPEGLDEVTDDNNAGTHAFAGLPVPQRVGTTSLPGVPQVQLGWDPIDDARVAGYRVYKQLPDGSWSPMGASPTYGFLDLSASFNNPRTYAIASYSARGIESPLSESITVMPVPAAFSDLLSDGFEAPLVP